MFHEEDSIWLDAVNEHLVVNTKDGWSIHLPFSTGVVEVNERLARFMAMFNGRLPHAADGEEQPPAIVIARKHGIIAIPCVVRRKFGHPN